MAGPRSGRSLWLVGLPLCIGAVFVGLWPRLPFALAVLAAVTFALGMSSPDHAFIRGALTTTPLGVVAVAVGFGDSWQLGALALVAAPFAIVTSGCIALAGSMLRLAGSGQRRRAAVLLGVAAALGVGVGVATEVGNDQIDRRERELMASTSAAMQGFSALELSLGAFDETWAEVTGAIGADPSFVTRPDAVELRFDLTPTVAPWLTRCLIATVAPIDDEHIADESISYATTSHSC